MYKKIIWIFAFLLTVSTYSYAQGKRYTIKENGSFASVIEKIESSCGYNFLYNNQLVDVKNSIALDMKDATIEEILDILCGKTGLSYKIVDKQIILSAAEKKAEPQTGTSKKKDDRKVTVSGTITDPKGQPLAGAYVLVGGTTVGCYADRDGRYSVEFEPKDKCILLYSMLGMKPVEVAYEGRAKQDVTLAEDLTNLEDAVVIGYGSKTRKNLTSAVSSVHSDEMEALAPVSTSIDNLLGGAVKGLNVTQSSGETGRAATVNIRGITSPYPNTTSMGTGNAPLYVIDNVPMFMDLNMINPLINLSPNDIESIDVLKDAAATAIYGSRGANGIIIIKTKSGKKKEKMTIEAGYQFSFANPIKGYDVLNTADFKTLQGEILSSTVDAFNQGNTYLYDDVVLSAFGNITSEHDEYGNVTSMTYNGLNESAFGNSETNWEKEILNKNAATHKYNVALRGGSEKTNYAFSFNAQNQEGMYKNDQLDHYGAMLNIDSDVTDWMRFGVSLNYSYSERNSPSNMDGYSYAGLSTLTARPDVSIYDETGSFKRIDGIAYTQGGYGMSMANPVAQRQGKSKFISNQVLGNAYLDIDLLKGLTLHGDFNFGTNLYNNRYFVPLAAEDLLQFYKVESNLTINQSNYTRLSANIRLDYKYSVNDHNFSAMAGYGGDRYTSQDQTFAYSGFPDDEYLFNAGSALTNTMNSDYLNKSALNSGYARVSYDYASRYLLEISMRADASSKFGPNNRVGFFPAVSAGWNLRNEEFMKGVNNVDLLKLRLSWGRTGSTNVADFSYLQFFNTENNPIYADQSAVTIQDVLPNRSLRWEMTTEYDAGIDFGFFDGRLYGSVDAYYRYTDGALAPAPHALESGLSSYWDNIIDMSNKGVEFELGGDIIRQGDFQWSS